MWLRAIFVACVLVVIACVADPTGTPLSLSYSPSPATVSNVSGAGTQVATISVPMSNASPFAGTLAFCSSGCPPNNYGNGGGLWALSGNTALNVATQLSPANNGAYHVTVKATQNGASVWADETITVASGGGGLACDSGPNAPNIPLPAQHAGFTTCLVNANFQSSSTDHYGINFSNTATYINMCGASPTSINTIWDLQFFDLNAYVYSNAPCSRATIANDPVTATQALDIAWLNSDFSNTGGLTATSIHWPGRYAGPGTAGGPNGGQGLWNEQYFQITFRINQAILSYTGPGIPIGIWQERCCVDAPNIETDFFEIQPGFNSGSTYRLATNVNGLNNPFANTLINQADNSYHTVGFLLTSNGTDTYSVCGYIDGGIATATPYGPCGVITVSNGTIQAVSSNNMTLWVGNCFTGGPPGCITEDMHFYVRDIQIWTCSTPWKGPCTGPVIQSNNDGPRHIFAWVDDLYSKIKNAILRAAHADWFNPPYSGFDWNRPPRSYGSTGSNSAHDCVGGGPARRNRRLCSDWPMMAWGSF